MSIELTGSQQQALDAEGREPRVVDPRTNTQYVLVPVEEFEAIREALDDDRRQRAIRRVGLRNAAGRAGEEP
jgi:PHD/YefM family antitoxin component YafN of YafNO toxin-antitoxin module